jgi:hypothetical protein
MLAKVVWVELVSATGTPHSFFAWSWRETIDSYMDVVVGGKSTLEQCGHSCASLSFPMQMMQLNTSDSTCGSCPLMMCLLPVRITESRIIH